MLSGMRTTLLPAIRTQRDAQEDSRPFNVTIVYDQLAAGQRAMRLFSHLDREHKSEVSFQPFPWRFDFVADPKLGEFAAADALKADLIIISTTTRSDLPSVVQDWLLACLARMRGRNAAIVALSGTEEQMDQSDSPRLEFLRRAAKNAGLDFFTPANATWEEKIPMQRWNLQNGYTTGALMIAYDKAENL